MSEPLAPNSTINNVKNNIKKCSILNTEKKNLKRKTAMDSDTISKQSRNNYFAILDNDKECDDEYIKKFEKHVSNKNNATAPQTGLPNTTLNEQKNSSNEKTSSKTKTNKIPPLNIFDVDPNELIEFISIGLKINEFKIKEFKNKKIALFVSSMNDYNKVKAYLQKTKTNFFTFTPKDNKKKTYLLKGLSGNTEPATILNELKKFENENLKFVKVSQFSTKDAINRGIELPMFLVQISTESNVNDLKSIKGLLYRCIRWEALKKPEIPQCRNCQGFFHSASNCFLPSRCVKCKEQHEIGKCSLKEVPESEREKIFCVLCNKYGHPASYKGCEKYKALQQKLRSRKQALTGRRINKPTQSYNVNPNISFANVLKNDNLQNVNYTDPINLALEEFKKSMQNLTNQLINLQKQMHLQASRIDSIFSMLEN